MQTPWNKSINPRTKAGQKRMIQANTKDGFYSAESIAERKQVREIIKAAREFIMPTHHLSNIALSHPEALEQLENRLHKESPCRKERARLSFVPFGA